MVVRAVILINRNNVQFDAEISINLNPRRLLYCAYNTFEQGV